MIREVLPGREKTSKTRKAHIISLFSLHIIFIVHVGDNVTDILITFDIRHVISLFTSYIYVLHYVT